MFLLLRSVSVREQAFLRNFRNESTTIDLNGVLFEGIDDFVFDQILRRIRERHHLLIVFTLSGVLLSLANDPLFVALSVFCRIETSLQLLHDIQDLGVDSVIDRERLAPRGNSHQTLLTIAHLEFLVQVQDVLCCLDRDFAALQNVPTSWLDMHLMHLDLELLGWQLTLGYRWEF